jgi:hypothetical protein
MPFLIPLAGAIASAISAAIAAVSAVVAVVASALAAAITAVAAAVLAVIVPTIDAIGGFIVQIASSIAQGVEWVASEMIAMYNATFVGYDTWVMNIYDKFHTLLEVIHFKTILAVSSIAMIVIPQYREMMKGIYGEISKVSNAIGLGSQFLTLALRNARNIVYDFSTSIGSSYDMAEITWLKSLNGFFQAIQNKTQEWVDNPEAVFNDIAKWLEQPAVDGKGSFFGTVWIALDTVIKHAETIAADVGKISKDLYKLLSDLPALVKDNLPEGLLRDIEYAGNLIWNDIMPRLKKASDLVDKYEADTAVIKKSIADTVKKILSPKDTMKALGDLPDADKLDVSVIQQQLINFWSDFQNSHESEITFPVIWELQAMLPTFAVTVLEPEILKYEFTPLSAPAFGKQSGVHSPFVGDF